MTRGLDVEGVASCVLVHGLHVVLPTPLCVFGRDRLPAALPTVAAKREEGNESPFHSGLP